jgi:hypothetical protein
MGVKVGWEDKVQLVKVKNTYNKIYISYKGKVDLSIVIHTVIHKLKSYAQKRFLTGVI